MSEQPIRWHCGCLIGAEGHERRADAADCYRRQRLGKGWLREPFDVTAAEDPTPRPRAMARELEAVNWPTVDQEIPRENQPAQMLQWINSIRRWCLSISQQVDGIRSNLDALEADVKANYKGKPCDASSLSAAADVASGTYKSTK